jgi:hypothetical protein
MKYMENKEYKLVIPNAIGQYLIDRGVKSDDIEIVADRFYDVYKNQKGEYYIVLTSKK